MSQKIHQELEVLGKVHAQDDLEVKKVTTLNGATTIKESTVLEKTLQVQGNATFADVQPAANSNTAGRDVDPAGAGSVKTFDHARYVRHLRITLADLVLPITAANDYGGVKFADLPNSDVILLACATNLSFVTEGGENQVLDMAVIPMGIGTAVASAKPLANAMQNIIEVTNTPALSSFASTFAKHSNDNTTPGLVFLADGASNALYLNATTPDITADDNITVNGFIDLVYIDIGTFFFS